MSPYQVILFRFIDFLRQSVNSAGEIGPPNLLSPTACRGIKWNLTHLIKILKQHVPIW